MIMGSGFCEAMGMVTNALELETPQITTQALDLSRAFYSSPFTQYISVIYPFPITYLTFR